MDSQSTNNNSNNSNALSKPAIVEWVNTSIDPPQSYTCIKEIPAKVAGIFMNNIFGDAAFPTTRINFTFGADNTTSNNNSSNNDITIAKRNCDAVLEGSSLLGFQPSFTGHSWAHVMDYGGLLLFWRWLRQKSLEKPLSRCITAVEIGLVPPPPPASSNNEDDANNSAPASARSSKNDNNNQHHPNDHHQQQNNRVVRLSEVLNFAGMSNSTNENSYNGPFMCGGPNGEIAKQLFESNLKELKQMRKQHEEISRAIGEGNLNRLVAALQAGHSMK